MTDPVPSLNDPMPDLAHDFLRRTALDAIGRVTTDIDSLRADLADVRTQLGLPAYTPPPPPVP